MSGYLPNLLIIGAGKCGTTSLHRYLAHHPEIDMSRQKELQLFSRDDWVEHLDWYRSQFQVRAPVRGESSPGYTMHPRLAGVPERIHEVMPNARLVYMVRDPVERTVAHYVEWVALRLEDRSLSAALADYASESNVYVTSSRYAYQLDLYRAVFPSSQLLVIEQGDLRNSRRDVLRRTFRFLGVDPDFWSPDFDQLHNTRAAKMRLNDRGAKLLENGWLQRLRGWSKPLPQAARERAKRLVADEVAAPTLQESIREELAAYLREDANRLRDYTQQQFAHWSV